MAQHYIGTLDEFPDGNHRIIEVKGRSIGVYRFSKKLYALLNYCPHQGAELCKGFVSWWVESERPGEFRFDKEGQIVKCPWHGWEFDVKTGRVVVDQKVRTQTYDVTVETFDLSVNKGKVYIEM